MHTNADKTHDNISNAAANNVSKNPPTPEALHSTYSDMANSSPLVLQQKRYQSIADATSSGFPVLEAATNSTTSVIQRSPAEWNANPDIARMLTHAHGWFSTWKKIKEKINAYKVLRADSIAERKTLLQDMWDLVGEWEAHPDHSSTSTEQRIINIRADMPELKRLIQLDYREANEDKFVVDYGKGIQPPVGIPDELTAGIGALHTGAAKAARLVQNINNFRFRYTGVGVPAQVAFSARQGDCGTLVLMFETVADSLGITYTRGNISSRLLVGQGHVHGRAAMGNTEGETDWYFHNHFWVISNGTAYDLLFMQSPPPAHIAYTGLRTHNNVNYHLFADGRVVIEPLQAQLAYRIQGKGRVFADEATAQNFIDANHV